MTTTLKKDVPSAVQPAAKPRVRLRAPVLLANTMLPRLLLLEASRMSGKSKGREHIADTI